MKIAIIKTQLKCQAHYFQKKESQFSMTSIHQLRANGNMKKLIIIFLTLQLFYACGYSGKSGSKEGFVKEFEVSAPSPDTLSFRISDGNNIIFNAVVDNRDTLDLYFDTGGTALVLKHMTIRNKSSLLEGKNKDYNEVNYDPLEGHYSFSLNKLTWDSLTIYPTAVGPEDADGHFGWDLFKDKMVELDYEKNLMIVHSALLPDLEGYTKSKIEYLNTLFCINSTIQIGDNKYPNRYLFDSGFQRSVLLDKDLRQKSNFPDDLPVIKESILRNGAGTEFVNRVVEVDEVCFGKNCAAKVPVQLLSTPNPARFETHILGNELLKRFNTILDFQNDYVYMKPNSLMNLPYSDSL